MESNLKNVLPLYQCHKKVNAAKIDSILTNDEFNWLGLNGGIDICVSDEYMAKHTPVVGGYYVLYEGGYESFSPGAVFESGYTEVNEE